MAKAHEGWVVELLSPLSERQQEQLHKLLGTLKSGPHKNPKQETP